jgi:hypothetical protein
MPYMNVSFDGEMSSLKSVTEESEAGAARRRLITRTEAEVGGSK